MKIGIDASRAFQENRTGIEEYSYQLIRHLKNKLGNNQARSASTSGHLRESRRVVLYLRKNQKVDFILPANWEIKIIKFSYLWTQVGLSLEQLFNPTDVLFVPAHVVPIIHPQNTIVTVHGLEYEFFPEGYSFWARLYMRWSIKMSCLWAKKIIAVSENTKKDLVKLYKVPEEKIEVIYEGVAENLKSKLNEKIINYTPYLLFIGRLEKRKNINGIISAVEILKEKNKFPHKLILAGNFGFGEESIKNKVRRSKYKDEIIMPGFIPDEDKGGLIENANVFLFPTFYEGFGLPVLEAQSLGVPVVTSNISSIPEVGGDSVVYCNPKKPESIAEAVSKLIQDQNLKNDIIKKGHENAQRFNWEKCAFQIAELLNIQNENIE